MDLKKSRIIISGFILLCFPFLYQPAHAEDAARGEKIFLRRCAICHYVDRDDNRIGPSLKNVMERQAGTHAGYKYSPAMIKAGENGLIWNRQALKNYLHSPQALVRGTRMASVKITSEKDIDDLISYMKQAARD